MDSVVPLDAVQNQKLKAPNQRGERELLPVLVEHVESPGHFYVRFEGQESRMLEDMMLQMRFRSVHSICHFFICAIYYIYYFKSKH